MKADEQKLAWLQALRGLAALMVVLLHDRDALRLLGWDATADGMLSLGAGVDLFFVISGFIMVLTTRTFDGSREYVWYFLAKRFARIWPIYAVATAAYVVLKLCDAQHGAAPRVLMQGIEGLAFVPHDPVRLPVYFQMAVGVAWTLCYEFYFYVVFGMSMLFGRWRYPVLLVWFFATLVIVPAMQGTLDFLVTTVREVHGLRYTVLALNPIVGDFVFGMLAAWIYTSTRQAHHRLLALGIAAIGVFAFVLTWHSWGLVNFYGPRGWGLPVAFAFVGIVLAAKPKPLMVPSWITWFGDISYSLYLVHVLVFIMLTRAVDGFGMKGFLAGIMLFLLQPTLAIMVAALTYRFVEVPLSAWVRSVLLARHGKIDHARSLA
jgi:exopolysaccharide production protein ExoZ